jgi:DNA replication protein DnaC
MERLNNIMRSTQGHNIGAQQRFSQQAQGPRHPARRPLPEQSGRLAPAARPASSYAARPVQPPRVPEDLRERWEEPAQNARPPLNRANYSGQRVPRVHPRYAESPPQGDYYEEERATVISADASEEWNDDTAGMRYGDWESAPGYDYPADYAGEEEYELPAPRPREVRPSSRPPQQQISPVAQRLAQLHGQSNPLATRELYRLPAEQPRPSAGREVRETRLPVPGASSQLAPAQPGSRAPQRTTQPLKPQQVARLHSEMQQHALRPPQPVLPETPREVIADYTITVNSTSSVCPLCKGAGYLRNNVPFGHSQFGKAVACQCKEQERKRKRRQQLQEISNLGAFASKRFATFNMRAPGMQEAFQVSAEFAKSPDGWLLFIGPNGCGKTHLAAAIANECLEAGAVVLFATVPDLLDHLRAAFAPTSNEVYDHLFARMREAEVLVLDDLGAQQSSPWANEKLFQLLNYRYNSGFPTVITANPRGLQTTDERVRSRLSDISLVTTLNLERARDYRPMNPHRD